MGTVHGRREQEIREKLEEIDSEGENLTEWEVEFVADLIDTNPRTFTTKQAEMVEKIYDERVP